MVVDFDPLRLCGAVWPQAKAFCSLVQVEGLQTGLGWRTVESTQLYHHCSLRNLAGSSDTLLAATGSLAVVAAGTGIAAGTGPVVEAVGAAVAVVAAEGRDYS